jgi:hypothetical protein
MTMEQPQDFKELSISTSDIDLAKNINQSVGSEFTEGTGKSS